MNRDVIFVFFHNQSSLRENQLEADDRIPRRAKRWFASSTDSQDMSFTARSYDLVCASIVLPAINSLSVVSFHLYSATDMSIAPMITE